MLRAALEAFALIGALGLVAFVSFGLCFGAGWWLDGQLGTNAFKWLGVVLGVAALYWNAAALLRRFWRGDSRGGR
jgi:hypothetical protein